MTARHGRRMIVRYAGNRFPAEVVELYAWSLRQVVVLLVAAAATSVVFAVLGQWTREWATFVFAVAAFVTVVAANLQQERTRNSLAAHGVIPGRSA